MPKYTKLTTIAAAAVAVSCAFADTTWTGNGTDRLWSNAGNWSAAMTGKFYFNQDLDVSKRLASVAADLTYTGQEINFNCGTEENPLVLEFANGATLSTDTHILVNNLSSTSSESYVRLRGNGTLRETKNNEDYLRIGANGTGKGTLVVENGAKLETANSFNIGYNACAGELILEEGAAMTGGQAYVGKTSKGLFTVKSGAYFYSSGDLTIARNSANASANADDWTEVNIEGGTISSSKFWLVYEGARKARMAITDGGSYTNRSGGCNMGRGGSSTTELVVRGEGSAFRNNGDHFYVANGGSANATIVVENGASLDSGANITLAHAANSIASATVNNAKFNADGSGGRLYIANGENSVASLTVTNGSSVVAKYYVQMGVGSGSKATLAVGDGSTVKTTDTGSHGRLQMGSGANSTSVLTINDGGVFQTATYAELAMNASSTSTVNINEGGVFATRYFASVNGAATINIDGGTLRVLADNAAFLPSTGITANIGANGAIIDTSGKNITIPAGCFALADGVASATISKIGGGTLTLTGTLASGLSLEIDGGTLADNADVRSMPITIGESGAILFSSVGEVGNFSAEYSSLTADGAYPFIGEGATADSAATDAALYLDEDGKTVKAKAEKVAYYTGRWYYNGAAQSSAPSGADWTVVFAADPGASEFNSNDSAVTWGAVILKGATVNFRQTGGSPRLVTKHIGGSGTISLMSYGIMNIPGEDLIIDEGVTILAKQHDDAGHRTRCFINKNGTANITVNGTIEVYNYADADLDDTTHSTDGSIHIECTATLAGPVVGNGEVRIMNERSPVINGDWSKFTGTLNKTTYNNNLVFACPEAVSSNATYNIVGDVHYAGADGSTVRFGALNLTKSNYCVFYVPATDGYTCTIEVGANGKDMTFGENYFFGPEGLANATYKNRVIHLKKVGAGILTDHSYGTHDIEVADGAVVFGETGSDAKNAAAEYALDAVVVRGGASVGGTSDRAIATLTLDALAGIYGSLAAVSSLNVANNVDLSGHPVVLSEADVATLAQADGTGTKLYPLFQFAEGSAGTLSGVPDAGEGGFPAALPPASWKPVFADGVAALRYFSNAGLVIIIK